MMICQIVAYAALTFHVGYRPASTSAPPTAAHFPCHRRVRESLRRYIARAQYGMVMRRRIGDRDEAQAAHHEDISRPKSSTNGYEIVSLCQANGTLCRAARTRTRVGALAQSGRMGSLFTSVIPFLPRDRPWRLSRVGWISGFWRTYLQPPGC